MISVDQIISELKSKGLNQLTLIKAFESPIRNISEVTEIEYATTTIM